MSIIIKCIYIILLYYRYPLQCGEYVFSFDKKNKIKFNKPCNIYTIELVFTCYNNYNNTTVLMNYTGLWGLAGDGDNFGFTFGKELFNGLLFEFQSNRSVLNIFVLGNNSIQTILLNSTTVPLATKSSTSNSVYTSYLPDSNNNNYRVEFTMCKCTALGFIGFNNNNNKIIAGIFLNILIISE